MTDHYHVGGWKGDEPGECGVECACGVTYDGFDSLAEAAAFLDRHIARNTSRVRKLVNRARLLAAKLNARRTELARLRRAVERTRQLCDSYKDQPPPIFRGPGLSEHGEGFNHGTRTLAQAVLSTIDDALRGESDG